MSAFSKGITLTGMSWLDLRLGIRLLIKYRVLTGVGSWP
jgi:hypothetical protein